MFVYWNFSKEQDHVGVGGQTTTWQLGFHPSYMDTDLSLTLQPFTTNVAAKTVILDADFTLFEETSSSGWLMIAQTNQSKQMKPFCPEVRLLFWIESWWKSNICYLFTSSSGGQDKSQKYQFNEQM